MIPSMISPPKGIRQLSRIGFLSGSQGFKLLHQELQAPIIQILQVDIHPATKTGSGMALFLCLSYAKKSWDDNNPHVRWDEICRSASKESSFPDSEAEVETLQCVIVSFTTACWKAIYDIHLWIISQLETSINSQLRERSEKQKVD